MNPTRKELIRFLKELGLIFREHEMNEEIEERILSIEAFTPKAFLSSELKKFFKDKGRVKRDGMFIL